MEDGGWVLDIGYWVLDIGDWKVELVWIVVYEAQDLKGAVAMLEQALVRCSECAVGRQKSLSLSG